MAGCRPGACGPRAIRPGDGRQRGIIQQARVPTDGQTPRNVAVEGQARSRVTGVQEGAAARCVAPCPGITLSDERGQEERAHSRLS